MSLRTHLATLEASGLIHLAQVQPELEYLFRHTLVQDAAYASLVKADRKQLHLAVGEALERLYSDRRDELAGVLALHFTAAGENEKAIHYSRLAAHRAESTYAYGEAIQHLLAALDLIEPGQQVETRLAILEELADDHRTLREGAKAISVYQSALELWAGPASGASADALIAARLHRRIIETVFNMTWGVPYAQREAMSQVAEASRAALAARLKQAETEPPHPEIVRALVALANDAWMVSYPPRWDEAERWARAAVKLAEQLDAPGELSAALDALASVHYGYGRLREHLDVSRRRLALSREPRFGDRREQVHILGSVGSALVYVGEYTQALPYVLEAESLSDHIRAVERRVHALGLQSQCCFRLDRWDDMFQIDEKRAEMEKLYPRERVGLTCFEIGLAATVHALRGEFDHAKLLREQAYAIMASTSGAPENWWRNQHY
jgi:tetratricopeptide (TPR) repeat protein